MWTWNDYLQRIKYFIRWIYNEKKRIDKNQDEIGPSDWTTPTFVKIKEKRSKRISPYLKTEMKVIFSMAKQKEKGIGIMKRFTYLVFVHLF